MQFTSISLTAASGAAPTLQALLPDAPNLQGKQWAGAAGNLKVEEAIGPVDAGLGIYPKLIVTWSLLSTPSTKPEMSPSFAAHASQPRILVRWGEAL